MLLLNGSKSRDIIFGNYSERKLRCSKGEALDNHSLAGEAFGRIRTDGVIAEDVQDGMKRREEIITFEGWWASFFVA